MELEILKLIYDYSAKGKIVDRQYIEKLVEIITISRSLNDYVKNIVWSDEPLIFNNGFVMASYVIFKQTLKINTSSFDMIVKKTNQYDSVLSIAEKLFYKNLILTQIILHEMEHAYQNKKVDLYGQDIETKLLSAGFLVRQALFDFKSLILLREEKNLAENFKKHIWAINNKCYEYHKQNPCERLAQIRSYQTIKKILEPIKQNFPYLYELEELLQYEEMLNGYTQETDSIICPTETYLLGTGEKNQKTWTEFDFFDYDRKKMQEKVNEKYDFDERLTYGLPVSDEEYRGCAYFLRSKFKKFI